MSAPQMLTPAKVAERWGIPTDKVRAYIASGQLRAVDFALRPNGKRPRWRIPLDAIAEFEQRRSSKPPIPKPQRRRKAATAGKEWF